jgi:hypothetical protein
MKLHKAVVDETYICFWCPGCKCGHCIPVSGKNRWEFDGNFESPTITPSLLISTTDEKRNLHTLCHVVVTAGVLNFCADSAHELSGKSVSMEDFPEDYGLP